MPRPDVTGDWAVRGEGSGADCPACGGQAGQGLPDHGPPYLLF